MNMNMNMNISDSLELTYPIIKQTESFTNVCAHNNVCNFSFTIPTTSGIGIGIEELFQVAITQEVTV